MSANENETEANEAEVYIGNELCGTLPSVVEKSKVYEFKCDNVIGDFVKIVAGR